MQVKTFVVGIANGYPSSFAKLDELANDLNPQKIHSLTDQVIPDVRDVEAYRKGMTTGVEVHIIRTIIYE